MTKRFIALSAFAVLLFSCTKKDQQGSTEEPENKPITITKEAVIGSYRITKVEGRSGGQRSDITNMWFSSYAGDCAKDDLTIFKPDESFEVRDGIVVCDESTDDTGTWKLLSNTQLKLDKDTAKIEAVTSTTLCIVSPVYSSPQGEIIFTYTRQ